MSTLRKPITFLIHLAVAIAVVGLLSGQYEARRREVDETRRLADRERAETARLDRENTVHQDLLRGLKDNDPYVVELVARDRLGYARPGEVAPPPLPTIDKVGASGTK